MQCAVRAAMNGRVLVLDGVEHAERNVLPILNNLLENREMHLENGNFLMAPERYDKLLEVSGTLKIFFVLHALSVYIYVFCRHTQKRNWTN